MGKLAGAVARISAKIEKSLLGAMTNLNTSDEPFTTAKMTAAIDCMASFQPAFGQTRIVESAACADQVIDTSGCRSPSRALRRWRRGIKGHVVVTTKPWTHAYKLPDGSLVMHPLLAAQVRNKVDTFSDAWNAR